MSFSRTVAVGSAVFGVAAAAVVAVSMRGRAADAAIAPMPPPAPVASQPGAYGPVAPVRLLDTRTGLGAAMGAVPPGASVRLQVSGRGGVPAAGISAAMLTVTAVGPATSGTVKVRASGATAPGTSVITFTPGVSLANLVLAPLGPDGRTELINSSTGTLQLVADLSGYYRAGTVQNPGAMHPLTPARLLDTRVGTGGPAAPVAPSGTRALQVTGRGGVPTTNVAAVLLNVDAILPPRSGSVAVWPAGTSQPAVSQLSFAAGKTAGTLVMARVGTGGVVDLANKSSGSVQLVADVFGYVLAGIPSGAGVYASVAPSRLLDTRTGVGAPKASVGGGKTVTLQVTGRGGLPVTNLGAVVLNVTAVAPSGSGTVTVWGDGQAKPATANLNYVPLLSTVNLVVAPVGADGRVELSNNSTTATQLVADVAGYYRADAHAVVTSTSHYVRNLTGGASDPTVLNSEGCADAQHDAAGAQHVILLDIGGQVLVTGVPGVQLSATSTLLTDAQLVTALNGYVDGYVGCRSGPDPTYIAVATNNDGNLRDSAAGADWADSVIDPVAAHAAGSEGIGIAGANDIEPDFTGLESEAADWTRGYLAATSAPYVFVGAASGCPTAGAGTCNFGWTQANFYDLAHGISPSRILALPQIYYPENAAQWKYIALSGASGADRIDFIGALSEFAACQTAGSGCPSGFLTGAQSWQALRNALVSSAAVDLQRLPVSTDLRIDSVPSASAAAKRVTTAGVR
jgi:hypothetical protein